MALLRCDAAATGSETFPAVASARDEKMRRAKAIAISAQRKADHDLVASAVFTPPFARGTVGMTEEEAAAAGPYAIYSASFRPMKTLFAGRQARVMMKLVVRATTRRVLGCHIVAPEAGEKIQLAAIAIKMGATKEQFDATCAVHPTMAEELVTMRKPVRKGA